MAFVQASSEKLKDHTSGRLFAIGSIAGYHKYMNHERTMYSFYKATLQPLIEIFNLETPAHVSGNCINLGTMRDDAQDKTALKTADVAEQIFQLATQAQCPAPVMNLIAEQDPYVIERTL